MTGSVADYEFVQTAAQGMDALIIAHMAPRPGNTPTNYIDPARSFDINVTGTVNLFHAAAAADIKRIVLISSIGAISYYKEEPRHHTLQPKAEKGLYALSKVCQEIIAEQYAREWGIKTAVLRVLYIIDGKTMSDKYGREIKGYSPGVIDRADIGELCHKCLLLNDLEYETFHAFGPEEQLTRHDVQYTCDRLGWKPRYTFSDYKEE
jgi:nucleoside-diphosphate-sugar epimerase